MVELPVPRATTGTSLARATAGSMISMGFAPIAAAVAILAARYESRDPGSAITATDSPAVTRHHSNSVLNRAVSAELMVMLWALLLPLGQRVEPAVYLAHA